MTLDASASWSKSLNEIAAGRLIEDQGLLTLQRSMDHLVQQQSMPTGPLAEYRSLVAGGVLGVDPPQALAAERLQDLWTKLRGYTLPPARSAGVWSRFLRLKAADWAPESRPSGIYIVGDVGRGKSMLMDLFFATAPVDRKQRLHFHAFMQDAHRRMQAWRVAASEGSDPIPALAEAIAAEATLLCFDEFQINDIADAIILGRLFEALFNRGVIVVATSNVAPDSLFAGRPGRDALLPFIALLKKHLDLLVLDGARDWRRLHQPADQLWIVPASGRAEHLLNDAYVRLSGGSPTRSTKLIVAGRILPIPQEANGVVRFDFGALCGTALGAGDYLAIATHYHTVILDEVPRLSPDNFDEARRFITLIDALYEHRVKLVASADAQPDALYRSGDGATAFERTASRLLEMQTAGYLALPHLT